MGETNTFESQFSLKRDDYLNNLDFLNWYRYFFIIKFVIDFMPKNILEVGAGSGIVKSCLHPIVKQYTVIDVNPALEPDIVSDVRQFQKELQNRFDCIICADVLEHFPFNDFLKSISNIFSYLLNRGIAIITIPHRQSNFLFMTPAQKPHVIGIPSGLLSPGGFYRRFIKRKIWIDPHHCWEIGDGKIKMKNIEERFRSAGFLIYQFKKLLYVDFWVLAK